MDGMGVAPNHWPEEWRRPAFMRASPADPMITSTFSPVTPIRSIGGGLSLSAAITPAHVYCPGSCTARDHCKRSYWFSKSLQDCRSLLRYSLASA